MTAKLKVGILVVLVLASSAAFAASANTSAEVDRSSSVDVVNDDAGLITLDTATPTTGIVSQNGTGALTIDFAQNEATGVNTASTFEIGNQSDPTNSSAFNITNQNTQGHDLSLGYTGATINSDPNIEFQVYSTDGTKQITASEESASPTYDIGAGETVYVVLVVNTHGLDPSVSNLSGTLTVSI